MDFVKWTSRQFDFDFPLDKFPFILNRLKGTARQIEEITKGLPAKILIKKINDAWSIQEHIGHLIDLDELHEGRIDDYLNQLPQLRAADMSNKKTYEAHHNNRDLDDLISEFRNKRNNFIAKLEKLDPAHSSFHPRLQKQMRVTDMAFFVAEHDDHHLMIIKQLLK